MNWKKKTMTAIIILLLCLLGTECLKVNAKAPDETYSFEYVAGLICGMICGVLFLAGIIWLIQKVGGKLQFRCKKDSYDERQLLARGQAYKSAFVTLMIYVGIIAFLNDALGIELFMSWGGMMLGICISLMVFATICIVKDAYMSLYENTKGIIMTYSLVALANIIPGICGIVNGEFLWLENGKISMTCINIMVGMLFLILLIVFGAKVIYNRKHSDEWDEE